MLTTPCCQPDLAEVEFQRSSLELIKWDLHYVITKTYQRVDNLPVTGCGTGTHPLYMCEEEIAIVGIDDCGKRREGKGGAEYCNKLETYPTSACLLKFGRA